MTVDEKTRDALIEAFGQVNDDIILKLHSLQTIFNVTTDDLYVSWETFNVNKMQENLDLTLENIDKFQEYLQSSITKEALTTRVRNTDIPSSAIKRRNLKSSGLLSSPVTAPQTPLGKRRKVQDQNLYTSSPGAYETAQSSFKTSSPVKQPLEESNTIVETLNPQLPQCPGYIELDQDASTAIKPFKFESHVDPSKYRYRTMSMKLLESADVLDDQIDTFAQLYLESNKSAQMGNPCLSSQFDLICAGRIVPDSPTYDKLQNCSMNSSSLYLETSRMGGIGQRIPLDLSLLKGYSLFPGQVVVLKGRNPTGRAFVVAEILKVPDLGAAASTEEDMNKILSLTASTGGTKVLIALGPFSNQHTLNFDKFEMMVNHINDEVKPHIVILSGPFVDISNTSVKNGDIEIPGDKQVPRNLDEVFKKLFTPLIRKINPRIQVILIPSVNDSIVKHCSYPQDAFDRKKYGLPKNVITMPNPLTFSINGAVFGVSNADIFKDLKDVFVDDNSTVLSNRFERVANHVLEQRRFYPYFPGSMKRTVLSENDAESSARMFDGVMSEELPGFNVGGATLEVPYLGLSEIQDLLPDIFVCPSEMKHFAKVVKGVVVLNPGYFVKGNRDPSKEEGSYSIMSIESPQIGHNVEKCDGLELYYHNIHKRARVDILKS